jgi:beta-N-acetylhexosaminidase
MQFIIPIFQLIHPDNLFEARRFFKKLSLVLMIFLSSRSTSANNFHIADPKTVLSVEDKVLHSMSLEQKIHQLFVFGFSGTDYHQSLEGLLRDGAPGGIIIFHRNIASPWALAKMTSFAQNEAVRQTGLPLLLMMDQEGGQVSRLKTRPPPPSALALGQSEDPGTVKAIGYVVGRLLDLVGVNMNLAPVLDLSDPFAKTFIGNRSFGSSPNLVSQMSQAFVDGMSQAGVLAVAKHFPGHGDTREDSHKGLTRKHTSKVDMINLDLAPFVHFAQRNPVSAMMVAHVSYPSLDPSLLPATYSQPILQKLLRQELNYNGLVITDDLEMFGAAGVGAIDERSIRALEAGADMIMVAWSQPLQARAKQAVRAAVRSGRLTETRIDQSVRRIVRAKLNAKKFLDAEPFDLKTTQSRFVFYTKELKALSQKVSKLNFENSIRQMDFSSKSAPWTNGNHAFVFSADRDFFKTFREDFIGKSTFVPISRIHDGNVFRHLSKDPKRIGVFYASGVLSAKLAQKIHPSVRPRVFIVNTNHPGLIQDTAGFAGVIHINTRDAQSGQWISQFLVETQLKMRAPANKPPATAKKREQINAHFSAK